jgi:protein-tyrosine-phosphatase
MKSNLQVEVICRLNQARSIIAEEFIRSIFENVQVNSSGVSAEESEPFPSNTLRLLAEFNLNLRKPHPERCESVVKRVRSSDAIIFSENYMQMYFADTLSESSNFLSLESSETHPIMRSEDPVFMDYSSFKVEIAKNSTQCVTLLSHRLIPHKQHRLICVVPIKESSEIEAFEYALKLQSEVGGLFISLNYRSKQIQRLIPANFRKLHLSRFFNSKVDLIMNDSIDYIVTQDYENDNLQNLVMSSIYRTRILEQLEASSVVVFTEPIRPHESQNAVAIFSCVYADEIVTIS